MDKSMGHHLVKNGQTMVKINTLILTIELFGSKNKGKSSEIRRFRSFLELLGGFEPPTSSLPRMRSTY